MQNCPKCKAKIGIMKETVTVDTGTVQSVKCFICGFWVQIGPWQASVRLPSPPMPPPDASRATA